MIIANNTIINAEFDGLVIISHAISDVFDILAGYRRCVCIHLEFNLVAIVRLKRTKKEFHMPSICIWMNIACISAAY